MENDDIPYNDAELRFFGRISASVTHELSNVFAIVREYSGLMDDLLSMIEPWQPVDTEKFKSIADKIGQQTKRGNGIIKRMNRFSHTVDTPVSTVDLTGLIDDITELYQRFASINAVTLKTQCPEEPIEIETMPYRLLQAIGRCLDCTMQPENREGSVTAGYEQKDGGVSVFIEAGRFIDTDMFRETAPEIEAVMKALNGTLETDSGDGDDTVYLNLP